MALRGEIKALSNLGETIVPESPFSVQMGDINHVPIKEKIRKGVPGNLSTGDLG